jgi:hypothetical protein
MPPRSRAALIRLSVIRFAKMLWQQPRAAAQQAYDAWGLVIRSQKTMMDSMRGAGVPFALAADQFDKLIQFQSDQYKAALEYMDKMAAEYLKHMDQQKK